MDLDNPAAILALAGLVLPEGAQNVRVDTKPDLVELGYHYAYTVSWDGTSATTQAFLDAHQIEWVTLLPRDDSHLVTFLREMAVTSVPEGSVGRDWSFHANPGYGQVGLLLDGPDHTTIHVAVSAFPS